MWKVRDVLDQALRFVPWTPYGVQGTDLPEAIKVLRLRWNRLLTVHPWSFLLAESTLTTGPGTAGTRHIVTLGFPVVSVYSVVDTTDRRHLEETQVTWIDAVDPDRQQVGVPSRYAQLWSHSVAGGGAQLEIWPLPSTSIQLRIVATRYEEAPSGLDDTSWIPWDSALVYGVAADMTMKLAAKLAVEHPVVANQLRAHSAELEKRYQEAVQELLEVDLSRRTAPQTAWDQIVHSDSYRDDDWL